MPSMKPDRSLFKPIALPQVTLKYDSSFVRAWAPDLEDYGIPQPVWLQFLQGLETCMAAEPPTQCVDLAHQGLGVDAYHWAVSGPLNSVNGDQHGVRLLRRSLTDRYITRANATFFDARGLKVRIIRGDAIHKFIKLLNPNATKAKNVAKASEKVVRRIPIVGLAAGIMLGFGKGVASAVTPVANLASQSLHVQAVLGAIASDVARLKVDVSWPSQPAPLQDSSSAINQKLRSASARKRESEQARRQQLSAIDRGDLTIDDAVVSLSIPNWLDASDQRRRLRLQARQQRRAYKHARRSVRRGFYVDSAMSSSSQGPSSPPPVMASSSKEDHLLWLTVYSVEHDKWIRDIQQLDSTGCIEIDEDSYEDTLHTETEEDVRYKNI